jgi:hypothetical protein
MSLIPVDRIKKERSPSYPFISLRKAVERATQFWEKHRREAARLASVGPTWGYGARSSGLQQTVGALKQYGLIEDLGSGEDRKIQLSDLGRRIVADQRAGARESGLKEAAMRPRLFSEYERWISDPPSEAHCLSELEIDRGFTPDAAKAFLRAFNETVSFAGLRYGDSVSSSLTEEADAMKQPAQLAERTSSPDFGDIGSIFPAIGSTQAAPPAPLPLAKRLRFEMTVEALTVHAVLQSPDEIDKLIGMLEANKPVLAMLKGEDGR